MSGTYIVYVKTNADGYIISVSSSAFLPDTSGWVEIDRGDGVRYYHANSRYFPLPIITDVGAYRYRLVDGVPVECTPEEIAEQEAAVEPDPFPTLESRVEVLELDAAETREALDIILSGVTE